MSNQYDSLLFGERVEIDRAELVAALKMQIRIFVEDEVEQGNEVSWRDFVEKYSEWNHESVYEIIVHEIVKLMKSMSEDARNGLSYTS